MIYEALRDGSAEGRGLSASALDQLTDNEGQLMAKEALAAGLVDRVGRWETMLRDLAVTQNARPLAHAQKMCFTSPISITSH